MISRYLITMILAALALHLLPAPASAQKCEGSKPRGGKWAASGELYLDRAGKNPQNRSKLYQQAVDVLTEGFTKQPDNPKNYLLAGQAYIGLADYAAADDALAKAEEMWSCYAGKIDTLRYNAWVGAYNRGAGYSNSGDFEKALKQYQDAYTIYDRQPQPLIQIAEYYAEQAQVTDNEADRSELSKRAIEYFREALSTIGRTTRLSDADRERYSEAATFNLGQLLAFEELYEEAAQAYRDFLSRNPDNVDARSNAAVVLTLAANRLEEEAEDLEDGPQKEEQLARAAQMKESALQEYAGLLAREDLAGDDYHNIGAGLSQIDQHEDAIVAYVKALDLEPYRANSLEQLAHNLFLAEKYDTLRVVAEVLVERYPLNLNNLALLANAYRELKESEKALEILEQREALALELLTLELIREEDSFTVAGYVQNHKLDAGTSVELQFDFYDDAGQLAATATLAVEMPEQGAQTAFDAVAESSAAVSGFTYRLAQDAEQAGS